MARILSLTSLILAIFIIISIILVNIGGVDGNLDRSIPRMKNSQFDLLSWQFSGSPTNTNPTSPLSSSTYTYHIFLNRICIQSRNALNRCLSNGLLGTVDWYYNANPSLFGSGRVSAYRELSSTNFTVSFAFFVLGGVTALVMTLLSAFGVVKSGRALAFIGVLFSGAMSVFMIIGAAVITYQMLHLRNQLRDVSFGTAFPQNQYEIDSVGLRGTAFGLIWAAVVASLITVACWIVALFSPSNKREVREVKNVY